jgi:SAM-dependent methyltransferase
VSGHSAEIDAPVARPSSVVFGRDRDVIPLLLNMHAPPNPRIIDVTFNRGVMWKGTGLLPYRVDVSREMSPEADLIADCRDLPFAENSFDVVAFDPPHLPAAAASVNSSGIERHQYGLNADGDYRQGDNINPLFADFLREARRVLSPEGIVIAKIADLVHNHRYQWQHVAFINAAESLGMTVCDAIIKADPAAGNLKSSKWKRAHHFRRGHCYWLVVRPGRHCEARVTPPAETDTES